LISPLLTAGHYCALLKFSVITRMLLLAHAQKEAGETVLLAVAARQLSLA
jgi:hypothetical protein